MMTLKIDSASPQLIPRVKRSANLDQWRGWAMVLVLLNHGLKHTGWVEGLGRSGVNLFFVISGILTAMSLNSLARKGQNYFIALPVKRLWRLYPVLIIYFGIVWLLAMPYGKIPDPQMSLWLPLYSNYVIRGFGIGHTWSIACEMHFYLLSPLLFFLGTKMGKVGKNVLLILLLILINFMGLYLLAMKGWLSPFNDWFSYKYMTHVAVWPMLLGFCLALYPLEELKDLARKLKPIQRPIVIASILLIVAVLCLKNSSLTVLASLLTLPVFYLTYLNESQLESMPGDMLEWVGKRTYSIYLFQQLLTLNGPWGENWRIVGALLALLVGGLFYYLVERRFLQIPALMARALKI